MNKDEITLFISEECDRFHVIIEALDIDVPNDTINLKIISEFGQRAYQSRGWQHTPAEKLKQLIHNTIVDWT